MYYNKNKKHIAQCIVVIFILTEFATGCVHYHPLPLAKHPKFPPILNHVVIETKQMPFPKLAAHTLDTKQGLDLTTVTILAAINNPDLRVARDELKLAQAQVFAAGLLPDPQISLLGGIPLVRRPDSTLGYSVGISYDVGALITRNANKMAAQANVQKTDLNLLWQEWQVISQARIFFVRYVIQQKMLAVLQQQKQLLTVGYQRLERAINAGDEVLNTADTQLVALQGINQQIIDLQQQINKNRFALNAILGLAPEIQLKLAGDIMLPPLNSSQISMDLNNLAKRRPDLLALRAGYQSQEQRLRSTILAQFPPLNVSATKARDTASDSFAEFGVTFSIPIFNGNRGNIAIEAATRQRLYDEYQQRLNTTYSEVKNLLADEQLLEKQQINLQSRLKTYERIIKAASEAYSSRDMDLFTYMALQTNLVNTQIAVLTLQRTLLEQRIGIQTLLMENCP